MTEENNTVPKVAPDAVHQTSPALGWYSDHILFHRIWNRSNFCKRDRSLVTISALITSGQTAQLTGHFNRALNHGMTPLEVTEVVTHLAFYAGWPRAMSAIKVMREVFTDRGIQDDGQGQTLGNEELVEPQVTSKLDNPSDSIEDLLKLCSEELFEAELWSRNELTQRDRSLCTLTCCVTGQQWQALPEAAARAHQHGVTRDEMAETVLHLAYYVGLPSARTAANIIDRTLSA